MPSTDKGDCVYVIGDIHGRVDLMKEMFERIDSHIRERMRGTSVHLILLGDLIDRGPDSARVLQFLFRAQQKSSSLIVLRGNHEDLMLRTLAGEPGMMRQWIKMGGDATLRSFGVEPPVDDGDILTAITALAAAMPEGMIEWLRSLPLTARSGDYLFCHAGIRPGVPIRKQVREDLLWIRNDFLLDETDHGVVVVHGHSIAAEVQMRPNRIGIDTGAYRTGELTALFLHNSELEVLSVTGATAAAGSASAAAA